MLYVLIRNAKKHSTSLLIASIKKIISNNSSGITISGDFLYVLEQPDDWCKVMQYQNFAKFGK